jgi:hypothetical protein
MGRKEPKEDSMRKLRIVLTALTLVGVLAGVTASSVVSVAPPTDDDMTLPLAIFVNRLELTPEQMSEVQDALHSVLSQVDAIEAARAAFELEMIRFQGSQDELDDALFGFREEMGELQEALGGAAREAVERLRDTLTIRQGGIIQEFLGTHLHLRGALDGEIDLPRGRALGARIEGREEMSMMARRMMAGLRERMASIGSRERMRLGEEIEEDDSMGMMRDRDRRVEQEQPVRERLMEMREQVRERLGDRTEDGEAEDAGSILDVRRDLAIVRPMRMPDRVVEILRGLQEILDQKLQFETTST